MKTFKEHNVVLNCNSLATYIKVTREWFAFFRSYRSFRLFESAMRTIYTIRYSFASPLSSFCWDRGKMCVRRRVKTNEKSVQLISPRGDLFLKCQKPNTMIISKIQKVWYNWKVATRAKTTRCSRNDNEFGAETRAQMQGKDVNELFIKPKVWLCNWTFELVKWQRLSKVARVRDMNGESQCMA